MNFKKILFQNREDAAQKLLRFLPIETMKLEKWIVISISAGGVEIAKKIADSLNTSFDVIFTEKIFAPYNKDCEIAIVTENDEVVIYEELVKSFEINLDFIFSSANRVYKDKILKLIDKYRDGKSISDLKDKNVLLVDEGLNTGLTMMACIKTAIEFGAKSVSVAVPVLPKVTVNDIELIADDLFYVEALDHFISIDFYYKEFKELNFNK